MAPRDPITLGRGQVDALSARLAVLMQFRADSEVWHSDVARTRGELAKATELLRLARLRALNARLERCRRPRWQVAPAQLGLFDARPVPPTRAGGTPIGTGFSLTREALGMHLPEWPEETPGTVPPALAHAVMCEERRRDLANDSWGQDEELEPAELDDAAPDELEADDGQAAVEGLAGAWVAPPPAYVQACEDYRNQAEPSEPDWAHPADVELVADDGQAEPEAWADPADVELVAEPSNVVELPRLAGLLGMPSNVMELPHLAGLLRTAGGRQ